MKVIFENEGEIDPRAFSTFGVNVKKTSNPIGYFGTGLKYALAVLMRDGCGVEVLSGERYISFEVVPAHFRGEELNFVMMECDGVRTELPFTTTLGKNWEMWNAYREIACNCIDEGGSVYTGAELPTAKAGKTFVVVTGDAFHAEYVKRGETILTSEPLHKTDEVEIHNGQSQHGFYRGVRALVLEEGSIFKYNMTAALKLTEDRTVSSMWEYRRKISHAYLEGDIAESTLRKVLLAPNDSFEGSLDLHWMDSTPSAVFLNLVAKLAQDKYTNLNPSALRLWKEKTRQKAEFDVVVLSEVRQRMLDRAIAFCTTHGFNVAQYPIHIVVALGGGTLGMASDDEIFITERVFHQGTKQLASTLIEEYLHLKHNYRDCTRELQTYLFDLVVSMCEEKSGEPL